MARPTVHILGGGIGGLTTAFYLARQLGEGDERRYERIIVYQIGWRLGGKGASSRPAGGAKAARKGRRIEEHGLHVWFGFYENAFAMLDECHRCLDAMGGRWSERFTSVSDSFRRASTIAVMEDYCGWKPWMATFPETDDRPWFPHPPDTPYLASDAFAAILGLLATFAESLVSDWDSSTDQDDVGGRAALFTAAALRRLRGLSGPGGPWAIRTAAKTLETLQRRFDVAGIDERRDLLRGIGTILDVLNSLIRLARPRFEDTIRSSDEARRTWYLVDLLLSISRGLLADGVILHEDFRRIDDWELRQWLVRHGAEWESVDCALVRAVVYDLAFAYEDGDRLRPACAAGTGIYGIYRLFFTYRGGVLWKMNAGMGEIVFCPLYEYLVKAGVEFRFFHDVRELEVDPKSRRITRILFDKQRKLGADWKADDEMRPEARLVRADYPDGPCSWAWPDRPMDEPDDEPAYEDSLGRAGRLTNHSVTLETDDLVVLALSLDPLRDVAKALTEMEPCWRDMLERVKSVPTMSMQLWLKRSATELGWPNDVTVGGFTPPFDTWADMPELVREDGVRDAKGVAYFTSVLPLHRGPACAATSVRDALALAKEEALAFFAGPANALWSGRIGEGRRGFNWHELVPETEPGTVWSSQYLRVNIQPSERYVLSVPGSTKARLAPDKSGFENLFLAGDWTECTINAGCIEAAVISGMVAANAINGQYGGEAVPIVGRKRTE